MTYNMHRTEEELLVKQLYKAFYITNEHYIVTYKLLYIYRSLDSGQESPFDTIKRLRKEMRRRDNLAIIDKLYAMAEHERLLRSGRYAPDSSVPPVHHDQYIKGWKLG